MFSRWVVEPPCTRTLDHKLDGADVCCLSAILALGAATLGPQHHSQLPAPRAPLARDRLSLARSRDILSMFEAWAPPALCRLHALCLEHGACSGWCLGWLTDPPCIPFHSMRAFLRPASRRLHALCMEHGTRSG
eukprot:1162133-Pelagomonas_calceolata.AAC.7